MTVDTFEGMALAEPIQQALRDQGYKKPSPIQAQAIPPQLEGRDILGCAQTGTGKTAAFALPILHHLSLDRSRPRPKQARALILTPTRELAVQVGRSFENYGKQLNLKHTLVYGGVSQHPQTRALRSGVDILVATPGRLLDLYGQGHLDLRGVKFLVLDEVDRMLDMGFVQDVRRIAAAMPRQRQTALFSATMSREVEQIAQDFVENPVRISVTPDKPVVENIRQVVCHVKHEHKLSLLEKLLHDQKEAEGSHLTLVFSRTKHGANNLANKLSRLGIRADSIHGDKSQNARQRALDAFREGKLSVLVATDVAARGIDVKNITLVVNYDLPEGPDTYVHRIGRTARADAHGRAVSFVDTTNRGGIAQIEKYIGKKIEVDFHQPFHDSAVGDARHSRGNERAFGGGGGARRGGGGGGRPFWKSKSRAGAGATSEGGPRSGPPRTNRKGTRRDKKF